MNEITYECGYKTDLARRLEGMTGRKTHSLFCQCDTCIPPKLKEEMKSWKPFKPGEKIFS